MFSHLVLENVLRAKLDLSQDVDIRRMSGGLLSRPYKATTNTGIVLYYF